MLKFDNKNLVFDNRTNTVKYIDPKTGNVAANMKIGISRNGKTLTLNHGRTMLKYRRRGIGTYLRYQIIKAAKNAGFHFVEQFSVNHTGVMNKPISAMIMEKLGARKTNNNTYYYVFNLKKNIVKKPRTPNK
jgi:predicted GNAT family acetyltransferase